MGRKKEFTERMIAAFPAGTLVRIDAALVPGEKRTDLIRGAVSKEVAKRGRLRKHPDRRNDGDE